MTNRKIHHIKFIDGFYGQCSGRWGSREYTSDLHNVTCEICLKRLKPNPIIMEDNKPTDREIEAMNRLLERLKKDPLFDTKLEFGKMLMRHIDSFTPQERARYDELQEILKKAELESQ